MMLPIKYFLPMIFFAGGGLLVASSLYNHSFNAEINLSNLEVVDERSDRQLNGLGWWLVKKKG